MSQKESFILEFSLPAKAQTIYEHWLDSAGHAAMTGADAEITDQENTIFEAWDGYITGKNLRLEPFQLIEQTWRTSEFMDDDDDSHLKISLKDSPDGCEVRLEHSNIPAGQTQYLQGWKDFYEKPMLDYFTKEDRY